ALELVARGAVAVVGGYCSGATIVEIEVLSESGNIPFVNGASDLPALTERGHSNFFRTVGRLDLEGPFAAALMIGGLGSDRMAIVHDDTPYSSVLASEADRAVH